MMIGTINTMKDVDVYSISRLKIPSIILMEEAARQVSDYVLSRGIDDIVIICGVGNNGGDGFAISRILFIENKKLKIYIIGEIDRMSKDCRINYEACEALGIFIKKISSSSDFYDLISHIKMSQLVIDCILGTGTNRSVSDFLGNIIELVNENSKNILSVDVPSGLNADTGLPLGKSICADKTITFQLMKRGFLTYDSEKYTGEVVVKNIGIPSIAIEKYSTNEYMLTKEFVKDNFKKRDKYVHKGDLGHVTLFGGSRGFEGAICLAAMAACKSGAGTVTMCVEESIENIVKLKVLEAMVVTYKEDRMQGIIERSKAIGIGPGMGKSQKTFEAVRDLMSTSKAPLIIDADGINVLKDNLEILKNRSCEIVITPHPGEFARLIGKSVEYVNENRIDEAKKFAYENDIIVVLKGYRTVVTDGKKVYVNTTGNAAMASGGMGDALTGILTSLIAQGQDAFIYSSIGVYLHGYCCDILSRKSYSLTATDLIEYFPKALLSILL